MEAKEGEKVQAHNEEIGCDFLFQQSDFHWSLFELKWDVFKGKNFKLIMTTSGRIYYTFIILAPLLHHARLFLLLNEMRDKNFFFSCHIMGCGDDGCWLHTLMESIIYI
jgi:hypothetical protein